MRIKIGDKNNIEYIDTIIDQTSNFFYYSNNLKPEYRVEILKREIMKNLPSIKINKDDLFIYIRSGDIFRIPNINYSQPPLCFYKEILNNFEFRNIIIIAQNKNNPVIVKLLNSYPKIIYNENPLKLDISYLINAYNLVKAPSTLFESIFQLNTNIKSIWEYDFNFNNKTYFNCLAAFINSFNIKKRKILVHKMKASYKYKRTMLFWKNTKIQRKLMLEINCIKNFSKYYI